MTYTVREIFHTLQGEGANAGRAAVFVRFAGCNLWSGRAEDRARDAERTGARCPLFCDTDFVGGAKYESAEQLAKHVSSELRGADLVVLTGGEPLLQLDARLGECLQSLGVTVAVETNGTREFKPGARMHVDFVCVSPKLNPAHLVIEYGDEIKVVYPAMDPLAFTSYSRRFGKRWVSPEATIRFDGIGESVVSIAAMKAAAEFCLENPPWRLSLQTHKLLGLR